ncbi:TetR family transcriptional regulator [Svornostia abyssi]|uniref:TetR family transcriptional regulator n=1 Tax=Svornostia abyssi TaxID=2898438 RepID=A0ABY5PI95_9ACTN|nr:TetR family transcriptional regulator [Parviterribacteraceae bacterium J379]
MARPARITRDDVAHAALRALDDVGYDQLSMRTLAKELGVGTMTLYHHVADKDDLVDAAIDLVFAGLPAAMPDAGVTGRARVIAVATTVLDLLLEHPGLIQARGQRALRRPTTLAVTNDLARGLLEAGVDPATAGVGIPLLLDYAIGCAGFTTQIEDEETFEALRQALPADEFGPLLAVNQAVIDTYGPPYTRRRAFEINVERILDGLGAR